jgi:hypothetical protein
MYDCAKLNCALKFKDKKIKVQQIFDDKTFSEEYTEYIHVSPFWEF